MDYQRIIVLGNTTAQAEVKQAKNDTLYVKRQLEMDIGDN